VAEDGADGGTEGVLRDDEAVERARLYGGLDGWPIKLDEGRGPGIGGVVIGRIMRPGGGVMVTDGGGVMPWGGVICKPSIS